MNIISPTPLIGPPPEQDIYLTRGDTAEVTLGFVGEPEVVANPSAYRQRLVIRRRQSDTLPDLVSVAGVLDVSPDERFGGMDVDVISTFTLSTADTTDLPIQGAFYFIEWTNATGGQNRRILQGRVRVGD